MLNLNSMYSSLYYLVLAVAGEYLFMPEIYFLLKIITLKINNTIGTCFPV